MNFSGSGKGGAPKRPGAGKSNKGYPKVSGADDASIDVRKKQQPPADLPPIQEPAHEPPADSAPPLEPVEPADVDTVPPEPPAPPQDDTETDGGVIPLPPSPAVPHAVEELPGNALPQTVEEDRPSVPPQPERPGWMEMPEANASAFGAEKAPFSADKVPGQTQPYSDNRTNGIDVGTLDEAGIGMAQPNESQGAFFSLGEGQEQFTAPSRKSRGQPSSESINQVGSHPTESGHVRRMENQGGADPVVAKPALDYGPVDVVRASLIPSSAGNVDGDRAEFVRRNAAEDGKVDPLPVESIGWGEFGRAHKGKQIRNRAGEIATILEVKNGMVTARSGTGKTLPLWQGDAVLVDANGVPLPASKKTAKRNPTEAGASGAESSTAPTAKLVPSDGDDPSTIVVLEGFKITKEFHDYLRLIERVTGNAFHPMQLRELLKEVTRRSFTQLDQAALSAHAKAFSQLRTKLVEEWHTNTGVDWPTYAEPVRRKNDEIYREVGWSFDAHHIIPQAYGGPHAWWNLIPATSPDQHQIAIHLNAIFRALFA